MILVVGGAGYIGSHVNKFLTEQGYETVVFDNLSTGHREAVKWGKLEIGDLNKEEDIEKVFTKLPIELVVHLAGSIAVGESVTDPEKYYLNNVATTLNLLKVMRRFSVDKIIFSSTAAVFGVPEYTPIDEQHPLNPINPYGRTKFFIEKIFEDYQTVYGLKFVVFRYFNACGAAADASTGEWHEPESHIIPILLETAAGKRENFQINGTDYPTKDGTCIRDYIHVEDLARAHILALKHLLTGGENKFYNLGSGEGYSNREIVGAVKAVTGKDFEVKEGPRREGDPPVLLASSAKIKSELGWEPKYGNIEDIVKTAWEWYKARENIKQK